MDKLLTNINGGFPFNLDDLRFVDNAVRDAFKGVLNGFLTDGIEYFIISGCEVETEEIGGNTTYTVSEGYIYKDSEVFYVAAHEVTGASSYTAYWDAYTYYDAAGNKTFENLQSHDTYQKREMKLYVSDAPPAGYMPLASNNLSTQLKLKLGLEVDTWHTVGDATSGLGTAFGTEWSSDALDTNTNPIRFKKLPDGQVKIEGSAEAQGSTPANNTIFTLPSGYRPTNRVVVPVVKWVDVPVYEGAIVIESTGVVEINNATFEAGTEFIINTSIPLD